MTDPRAEAGNGGRAARERARMVEEQVIGRGITDLRVAEAMRRVILDHARARRRLKRGGGKRPLDITSLEDLAAAENAVVMRFDEALRRLEEVSQDIASVVRLRLFAGLTGDQAAAALGVSPTTVDRRWALARAWLFDHLRDPSETE